MQCHFSHFLVVTSLTLGGASIAHAGIDACGDIDVDAQAQCEMRVDAACTASCEPVQVQAACAAHLSVACEGECDADLSVECTATCAADCSAECTLDPGSFDCEGTCEADCGASCAASCEGQASGDGATGRCEASCRASCSGTCSGRCEGVPPSAECDARCEAKCEGQCEAEANLDCQVDCQADGYAQCEVEVQGGCEAECEKPEGALFCDGQYIDHQGKLEECVNALRERLDIEVEGYAYGDADCTGSECSAEGEAGGSVNCAVSAPGRDAQRWAWFGVLLAPAAWSIRKRRRHMAQ